MLCDKDVRRAYVFCKDEIVQVCTAYKIEEEEDFYV